MNTIEIIQEYMGEDLTPKIADRLADAPDEHIPGLIERLAPYYYDWLENEETNTSNDDNQEQHFFCIDPFPRHLSWQEQLDTYKKYLLYFPRFTLPDPLASFLWPHITMASMFGTIRIDEKFRTNLKNILHLLAELAPTLYSQDVFLMPIPFVSDYEAVQDGARKEMASIDATDKAEYYGPNYKVASSGETDESGMHLVVGSVEVLGQICAKLDLTPIAGNGLVHQILRQDYKRGMRHLPAASKIHRITEGLLQFDVPGIEKASVERIVSLRKNVEAFAQWRSGFGELIKKAQKEHPQDDEQFKVEFRQAAEDLLARPVKDLEKATSSSILEKILVPGSLSIGAGAVAFHAAMLPTFPATALAAAALAPMGWVIDKAIRRFNKTGRKAVILREFYGYLLEKAK